jgi:uncharacterized protein (AIM24 family)
MASFEVHELEGVHYVDIALKDETVRAEAGALSYLTGDIVVHSRLIPSVTGAIKSVLAEQAIYRPTYSGTGVVTLLSSLGGFHILDLQDECWILERGVYWASEGSVDVSFHRVDLWTAYRAGEPLIYLQTKVRGSGKVAVRTRGPVEEMMLSEGQRVAVDGKSVIGWSSEVRFRVRRPTINYFGKYTSGQGRLRVFFGPGRVLLNPAPHGRYRIFAEHENDKPFLAYSE